MYYLGVIAGEDITKEMEEELLGIMEEWERSVSADDYREPKRTTDSIYVSDENVGVQTAWLVNHRGDMAKFKIRYEVSGGAPTRIEVILEGCGEELFFGDGRLLMHFGTKYGDVIQRQAHV